MRLFLFLILLLPALSFGQACTEGTLSVPDGDGSPGTYSCTTLDISPSGLNRSADGTTDPIIVTVTGDVTIRGNINVNGGNGFLLTVDPTSGPSGGPGAVTGGGGVSGLEGEPLFSLNPEDGLAPFRNGVCNEGGSGAGGFNENGDQGLDCSNNPGSVAAGAAWGVFPLTRGGFGGGAGGAHDVAGVFNLGSGGGGGGAIHIISTGGTITISTGVTISARGGNGGNATSIGGAGGGGSGGVILLDGALGVINNGTLDVRGGSGGVSTAGGEGGAGKSGVYRVVSAGVATEGTGQTSPNSTSTASSSSKLSSDISCGTISKTSEQNQNNLFMILAGFGFVSMITFLSRFKRIKVY